MCERASGSGVQKSLYLPTTLSHRRSTRTVARRTLLKHHRARKSIERWKSEPCFWRNINGDGGENEDDRRRFHPRDVTTTSLEVLFRPQTCTDLFFSSDYLNVPSPKSTQVYKKDAKVVVNVTIEGTLGPIKTMVKLGSNVEETIKLVLNKYKEEGRSPHLDDSSSFKLYTSHFSLESLNNSDVIGYVGSRSFHLRKSNSNNGNNSKQFNSNPFLALKINKFIKGTSNIWKLLSCIHCFE
ncbi:uncharacterized protein At4g22758-like isoform X1 [Solanum pennellii]|uniref:Uncharacterized protein At4g22758-like isoform X1 n=1 Tax=Solanum pennellii TaxID=28526 RepID=A0ABM1HEV0_SOLPN|nr:uncharacterized protein At4g22758-like isoform X1 [Solanum pennellii]